MGRSWPTITRHRSLNPVSVPDDLYLSSGSAVKQLEDCALGSCVPSSPGTGEVVTIRGF